MIYFPEYAYMASGAKHTPGFHDGKWYIRIETENTFATQWPSTLFSVVCNAGLNDEEYLMLKLTYGG